MTTPRAEKRRLAERTWPEVADGPAAVLLVPLGSCEQHGPHLPLDTDTRVAVAVAEAVAALRDDVVVAPALAYGSSGEHAGFAGTLSIGAEALRLVLVELGRSAFPPDGSGAHRGLVLVNGHGGNAGPVAEAVALLEAEGRPVTAWSPRIPGGDAHAGRTETSLVLAVAADLVGAERPTGATEPLAELLPRLRAGGVAAVSANGVLGAAAGASAEEGRRLLAALADDLVAAVDRLTRAS
ncbi:MAG: mycofactocin biosynthesis peptidyl-dipeptidase MftE [Acidimicrobiia bacterium]